MHLRSRRKAVKHVWQKEHEFSWGFLESCVDEVPKQAAKGSRIWVPCAGQMRLLILQQYPASVCLVTGKAGDVSGIIITRYPRSLSIYGQNVAAAYAGTGCGTCWADLCIIFCRTKLND